MSARNSKSRNVQDAIPGRDDQEPGCVGFDDRGNAVFQWSDTDLTMDGEVGDRLRSLALDHPGLSLMDDTPPPGAPIVVNEKAVRQGYDPYESGLIKKNKRQKKRTDLRELSKWIEMQRTKGNEEK